MIALCEQSLPGSFKVTKACDWLDKRYIGQNMKILGSHFSNGVTLFSTAVVLVGGVFQDTFGSIEMYQKCDGHSWPVQKSVKAGFFLSLW